MSKTFNALIRPDTSNAIFSKYIIEGGIGNPETGIEEQWTFNVNADVSVPQFHSVGAAPEVDFVPDTDADVDSDNEKQTNEKKDEDKEKRPAKHTRPAPARAPVQRTLVGTYDSTAEQLHGFSRFTGSIGAGRFYLKTHLGVVIRGEIVGGPVEGQSFVGSGSWLKS